MGKNEFHFLLNLQLFMGGHLQQNPNPQNIEFASEGNQRLFSE